MPKIDFPLGLQGVEHLPRTRRTLQNCFNNGSGSIIGRPGIQGLSTTSGVARGQFVWNGALYQVVSQELIKITNTTTGANSTIGTIAGPQVIESAIGFNHAVIVVKGGAIYTLNSSDTLTDISGNSNFVPCDDVCHINGRFVYIPSSGDPAFFSDVGAAGTVQSASFFDAEELPDKNKACFDFRNTLFIAGTDSFEQFRDTGASPNPFIRVSGARIQNGYIGGLLEYNGTFLFCGREKDQDFGIYSIADGQAAKISNEAIDLILSTYTQNELAEAISGRIKWRGYDIATFKLRRDSFGFFGGQWFPLESIFDETSRPWGGGFITQFEGEYFTAYEDQIGKFADINTDYGNRITRIVDFAIVAEPGQRFGVQSISLGITQGYNASDGSVALMVSRDNVTYTDPYYRSTGKVGEYNAVLEWNPPGGLGQYDGFMGVRFYTTEDVSFSADSIGVRYA